MMETSANTKPNTLPDKIMDIQAAINQIEELVVSKLQRSENKIPASNEPVQKVASSAIDESLNSLQTQYMRLLNIRDILSKELPKL